MAKLDVDVPLVGREKETKIMRNLLLSKEAELLAVIGRRRVGKTFLIKKVYREQLVFQITGIQNANKKEDLFNFIEARNKYFPNSVKMKEPNDWFEAFSQLKKLIKSKAKKQVLFFDELPWLALGTMDFLKAFDNFWNSWAVDQNIIIVICGSSASWMITNVVNNKGGLHNRISQRIHLHPFTLSESDKFLRSRNIVMPRQSIIELYMTTGGIPYYLKDVERGKTSVESINQLFFGKNASLLNEFQNLYRALFSNYEKHISVIRALSSKKMGLTRPEIIEKSGIPSGGALSTILYELEASGFILCSHPYGKKSREAIYRITDEYSLFYLSFVEKNGHINDFWLKKYNAPSVKSWQGYAFENVCFKHVEKIKHALGISGIYTSESSFYHKADEELEGCQIDLLIDRGDNAINICEVKHYNGVFSLTDGFVKSMQRKRNVFVEKTKTKNQIFLTLITAEGITENKYSMLIDKCLDADCFF